MNYTIGHVKNIMDIFAETLIASKGNLNQLDGRCGDGDLGLSMEKGALALKQELMAYQGQDIGECFLKCAMTFNKAAPSTMGTLISAAIMMLGKEFKGKSELSEPDVIKIPFIMADAITNRGKAKLGDKTILDALIPMAQAFKQSYQANADLGAALKEAAVAAKQGAESTKGMVAKIGRAKWIAERSQEFPDAGAILCTVIVDGIVNKADK